MSDFQLKASNIMLLGEVLLHYQSKILKKIWRNGNMENEKINVSIFQCFNLYLYILVCNSSLPHIQKKLTRSP